jgi:multidrug efflux pump
MIGFALVVVLTGFLYTKLPTGFVPDEDQGFMLALINLPSGATIERTNHVMTEVRETLLKSPIGKDITAIFQPEGFSFVGTSENVGMAFIKLSDWGDRSKTAMELIPLANGILRSVPDAQIFVTNLPTIRGLSQFGGIDMYLQARAGQSRDELTQAQQILITAATKSPVLFGIRPNSLPTAPQLNIAVDRDQAQSLGLSLSDVYATIQSELAPSIINQFTYGGRVKRVYIQADAPYRMSLDAFQHLYTPSNLINSGSGLTTPPGTSSRSTGTGAGVNSSGYLTQVNPSAANTGVSPVFGPQTTQNVGNANEAANAEIC